MDSALIARIGPEHRRQLAWFEEHEGQVSGFPAPLEGGLLLVSKPKGIYKPQGPTARDRPGGWLARPSCWSARRPGSRPSSSPGRWPVPRPARPSTAGWPGGGTGRRQGEHPPGDENLGGQR